jgi:hypothetical protein
VFASISPVEIPSICIRFAKKFNLEFNIEVNNFPTQLISVIARKLSGSEFFPCLTGVRQGEIYLPFFFQYF